MRSASQRAPGTLNSTASMQRDSVDGRVEPAQRVLGAGGAGTLDVLLRVGTPGIFRALDRAFIATRRDCMQVRASLAQAERVGRFLRLGHRRGINLGLRIVVTHCGGLSECAWRTNRDKDRTEQYGKQGLFHGVLQSGNE